MQWSGRYLIERGFNVNEAEGVHTKTQNIDSNQGDQRLGNILLDNGHLQESCVVGDLQQQDSNRHLTPEQKPRELQSVQCPLMVAQGNE